jgi:hypothetical protein
LIVLLIARHDTTRHDTTRHDTTRHDTTRHDTTRRDTTRHDTHYGQGWETLASNQLHFIGLVQRMLRDDLRYYKAINLTHGTE